MALTPEQLARYQSLFMDYNWRNQQKAQGNGGLEYLDPTTGQYVIPQFVTRGGGDENGGGVEELSGFATYDSNDPLVQAARAQNDNIGMTGAQMGNYDAQGNFIGGTEFSGAHKNSAMDYLLPLAMVAGPFAAMVAPGLFGLGAGAAGGAGTSIEALAAAEAAANAGGAGGAGLFGGEGLLGGMGAGGELAGMTSAEALAAAEMAAGAGLGPGAALGAEGLAAYAALPTVSEAAMAAAMGMTPEAFAALGAGGLGAAGAAAGMTAGTAAPSFLDKILSDPSKLLGPAATVAGALAGSQGQQNEQTAQQQLPDFLKQPVGGDLVPRTQGLLASQMDGAGAAGQQMLSAGGNLLSQPIAGNGYGTVKLNAPTTETNPYLSGMADDIQRRTSQMLGEGMAGIQSRFVGGGGYGNTRQGVAQGVAGGKAADYMSGQLAGLFGNAYSQDQNRALQQYQADQGFYTANRGQDLAQATTGAGLLSTGLDTQWSPLKQANSIYSSYSPYGNKTISQDVGGGWLGGVGGALGAAQLAKNFGLWGGK